MEVRIKHNKENIKYEKPDCTEEEILKNAQEILSIYYSHHINQIEINGNIIKFKIKLERL